MIALVINGVASGAQQIRSAVIKQLERDYVRTLRSRGIGEREILFKHVLRSAAPAGLTVLSLQFIGMLGGVVIIEQIFALPGMGPLAVTATTQSDLPVVMGVVIYTVLIVIVVNLLVDILNGWLNPKVRVVMSDETPADAARRSHVGRRRADRHRGPRPAVAPAPEEPDGPVRRRRPGRARRWLAVLAPVLAPVRPELRQHRQDRWPPPDGEHPLGTDSAGPRRPGAACSSAPS